MLALLIAAMWLPSGQRVLIAGADFSLVRILCCVALAKFAAGSQILRIQFSAVDLLVVGGGVARALCTFITHGGIPPAITSIGGSIEIVGAYLVTRAALRSREDLVWLGRWTLVFALPIAAIFMIEWSTGRNMLSVFGGVPLMTAIREGRLRCQGAFAHPILAGCFFVALAPLWVAQWSLARGALICWTGLALTSVVVFCCSSSTPLAAFGLTVVALLSYRGWRHLRIVLYTGIASAIVLHFLMTKGIWHLIARIDLFAGNTGWHRAHLIEESINHFDEWWLFGTVSTAHWGYGLQDVTNQYLIEGTRGGIWAMFALLLSIVISMAGIGRALRRWPDASPEHWMAYCAGVSIFAQSFIFLAVSYFGQTVIIWPVTLAIALLWGELADAPRSAPTPRLIGHGGGNQPTPSRTRFEVKPLPAASPEVRHGGDLA
ncbi:MAG: hypothetical protein ACO3IB_08825 [Phycisphaerales bacterium]